MPFDQRENFRKANFRDKARIAQIERILNAPPPPPRYGRPFHPSQRGRLVLEEEKQELLFRVADRERTLERLIAFPSLPPVPTLVRRRQHRPVDARKELIASLKARYPNARSLRICELIDREISSSPARKAALAPLESWRRQAQDTRSWVGFYDHAKTHNLVRSYVNKVPPLKTAKSQK